MISFYTNLLSSDDSTLYVKTVYQHIIVNGRNTAQKYAIKQEMRNSDGELFREVFYDPETKQVDYTLYYYYNPDRSVRLIEKVDINEVIFEYKTFKYKKEKVKQINTYSYNPEANKSTPIQLTKYTYKKEQEVIKTLDNEKQMICEEIKSYDNERLISSIKYNFGSDSIKYMQVNRTFKDTLLILVTEKSVNSSNDTLILFSKYSYNQRNLVDTITTYDKNELFVSYTVYQYFKEGADIRNVITVGPDNYYKKNITYDLTMYYRDLPTKESIF